MVLKNAPQKSRHTEIPDEEELSLLDKFLAYKVYIALGIVLIVIAVLALAIITGMQETKQEEAWTKTKELREQAIGALAMGGNLDEAIRAIEMGVDSYPDTSVHPWLLVYQALLYKKADKIEDAQKTLERLKTLYPKHPFTNPNYYLPGDKPFSMIEWDNLKKKLEFEKAHGKPFSSRPVPQEGLSVTLKVKDYGDIKLGFFPDVAPKHVANFFKLAKKGFFDGTAFHGITEFGVRGGDPNSKDDDPKNDGTGGPGYQVEKEIRLNPTLHIKGTLSAESSNEDGPDSGSQFFLCIKDAEDRDGKYTPYGEVISGMEVLEKIHQEETHGDKNDGIAQDHPVKKIIIEKVVVENDFSLPELEMPGYFEEKAKKEAEEQKSTKKKDTDTQKTAPKTPPEKK